MGITGDLVLILLAALLAGAAARRLGLPLVLGYVVAGIAVGPHTPGPTVVRTEDIELLADVGVALLLLAVGLDLPLQKLAPVRRVALVGGVLQIAEQGTLETMTARIMVGILLVQDLAVVPLLVLLPGLQTSGKGLRQLGATALGAEALVAVMVILGTRIFPPVLVQIARWRSRELFFVATVAAGLGVGYGNTAGRPSPRSGRCGTSSFGSSSPPWACFWIREPWSGLPGWRTPSWS